MSLLGGLLGGVFSIFSKKKERRQAKDDAANKFVDLRKAAEKGGFNPLTALQTTGGSGFGAYGTSGPPLASVELLTGALESGIEEVTGVAAQRRASDRLALELGQLKLDQARSGVVAYVPQSAGRNIGAGPSLGRQTATIATTASKGQPAFGMGANSVIGNRPTDIVPATNSAGAFEIENNLTFGPITLPGDGDPWGIDEVATAIVVGAPQLAYKGGQWLARKKHEFNVGEIARTAPDYSRDYRFVRHAGPLNSFK